VGSDASITGKDFRFIVRADRYAHPDATSGWEANRLVGSLQLHIAAAKMFDANAGVALDASEIASFADQLRCLDRELTGEAVLGNPDSDFEIRVRLTSGKGSIEGMVREWGADLRFRNISTDQSYISAAVSEFDAFCAGLPPR
jgi:hypothetical protein